MNTKTALVGVALLLLAPGESLEAREPAEPPPSDQALPKAGTSAREGFERPSRDGGRGGSASCTRSGGDDGASSAVRAARLLELVQTKRGRTRDGSVIWSGRVAGQPASTVDLLGAAKRSSSPTSRRSPRGSGRRVLRDSLPGRRAPRPSPDRPVEASLGRHSRFPRPWSGGPPTCTSDPADTIDVLVVYTPKASDSGGRSGRDEASDRGLRRRSEHRLRAESLGSTTASTSSTRRGSDLRGVRRSRQRPGRASRGRAASWPTLTRHRGTPSGPTSWSSSSSTAGEDRRDELRKARSSWKSVLECLRKLRLCRRAAPLRRSGE